MCHPIRVHLIYGFQICTCKQGYEGNPEIRCIKAGCSSNSECSLQHECFNRQCVPACRTNSCGSKAECLGKNHKAGEFS